MPDRLGDGRLLPAAKPVSSFITPAQVEAQKPAAPTRVLASNGGIGLQATAAKPNVPGYNPGVQLGEALQRFGANLTQTLGAGLEMYASHEYQAGMNEVAKATALAERQVQQSGVEYAGANRELARVDPLAAMAMDQTNPFRHAGRQRALSQVAAGEIGTALQLEYRNNAGDLVLKDPTDPVINQTKARAVNAVIEKYGLDPSKSGFAEVFLPALNRGWEKVTAQHIQDRNNYLKDTVWRTAGVAGAQVFRQFRQEGKDMGQAAAMVGALLDQEAAQMGLPGEAMDMKEKAIKLMRQTLINAGEFDAAQAVGGVPIGPADSTGYRQTATQMLQLEMMEADDKYGEIRRRARERELEPVREALTAEVGAVSLQVEDGPGKLQALQDLMNDPRFAALPLGERLDVIGKANKMGEEILGQGYTPEAAGTFIAELDREFGFGSQRDMAGAEARLQEILGQTAPEDRGRLMQQFADWKNKQQKQPWDLINPAISNKIKAELEKNYASSGSAAALRGATNITDVLAWGDATAKESSARQLAAYRTHVLTRLDEERTKLGRDLSDSEALGVINRSLQEYGKSDPDAKAYLFPKIPGSASAPGQTEPAKPTPPPGRKPSPVQGYNPTTLDTAPDRAERLKQWQNQPLLDAAGTRDLLLQSLNGRQLPAAFKRAAKDAGITPEQLLLKQADFYPNAIKVTPEQRNQLLRKGNQTQALNNNRQQRGAIDVAALVRKAGSWMVDSVMGIQPAMARTSDIELMRRYSGGAPSRYQSRDPRAQALIAMAARNGWDAADLAAVFSFETGGTLNPGEPGRGAAAGRIGLIQAGSQERADYGLGSGDWNREMLGVERYLKARGFKAGMSLADLYATVNGGNPRAGNTPDGNGVVARSASTQRALQRHRQQALTRLGMTSAAPAQPAASGAPAAVPAGWKAARSVASASGFGASESFRNGKGHEGMDLSFRQGTPLAFSVGGQVLKVYRTSSTAREANGGYGNYMDIKLENGLVVRMAHLSQIPQGVTNGTRFTPGQSIALSGGQGGTPGAGRSTGAHLHFEEHSAPGMGIEETTRGKVNPARRGGALDYLIWRGG